MSEVARTSYDPAQLVIEVMDLLTQAGLRPVFADSRSITAQIAASQLLRALSINPGLDAEAAYARNVNLVWGENQDVV